MSINKHLPDCSGFYLGKVLKHLSYGRIKVWIPGIHEDKYKDKELWKELPTAVQVSPIFGGVFKGNGMFSYPNIDSMVVCFFINKDQNYPAYFASVLNGKDDGTWDQWDQIFPDRATEGESHIHNINIGQTYLTFHEDGSIELCAWNRTDPTESKIILDKEGNVTIRGHKQLTLDAPTVEIKAIEQVKITSPSFTNINTKKNTTVCDKIELNAVNGSVTVKTELAPGGTSFV